MIEILLVNPRIDNRQRPPLGLAYISALLKKNGISVCIFDPLPMQAHNMAERLLSIITQHHPKIVGFTATTAQISLIYSLAQAVKANHPKITTIIGGVHATVLPDEVISKPYVDFVVVGEGEHTALELFSAIESSKNSAIQGSKKYDGIKGIYFKEGEKIRFTGQRELISNLDELPYPARELLDNEWYSKRGSLIRGLWLRTATIITSRGCPGQCTYCASKLTFGLKIRRRSVQNVIEEINGLIKKYRIQGLFFCDDTLTTDKKWMSEFCTQMAKLNLIWACQSRVNTVDKDMLKAMKCAGCVQIEYGCESGSQKVLNILKKNITVEQIKKAFALTKEAGIRSMANFMIGNPEETSEDIETTANLAKELKADYTEFWITTPYPGSELFNQAKNKGWLKSEEWGKDWAHGYLESTPVMEINFTAKELTALRDKLYAGTFSPIFKTSMLSPLFVYDFAKYLLSHPLASLKALIQNRTFVRFGLQIEKEMRGEKKDIIV